MAKKKPEKGDRKVIVVVDKKGGAGKTSLTKWMQFHMGALVMNWGRDRDLQYMVSQATTKHLIIFDLARSRPSDVKESETFCTVEAVKNGSVLGSKWETKHVMFQSPVVIVFMNYFPDPKLLSEDRWNVFTVDAQTNVLSPVKDFV